MEYYEERRKEKKEVKHITVSIGLNNYRLYETIDGKLGIHKSTDSEQEEIIVFPRVTNVINIT